MSEKRLIKREQLCSHCDIEDCMYHEDNSCIVFDTLPQPTLADVCGSRKLENMTEGEFEELLKVGKITEAKERNEVIFFTLRWIQNHRYQLSTIKWFIEHGFNVFGEEK